MPCAISYCSSIYGGSIWILPLFSTARSLQLAHLFLLPADHQVRYVSPAYERVLGGHLARVNDEFPPAWAAALPPDDRPYLAECLAQAAAGAMVEEVQLRLPESSGGCGSCRSPGATPHVSRG